MTEELRVYIDYKSPFAFLALEEIYRLADNYHVTLTWRHYTLDIPSFLDTVAGRSAHNWRKVKYSYMDARRIANRRGIALYGPQKIFDSMPAGIGMYWAENAGNLRAYSEHVFERFFRREIELGSIDAIGEALQNVGIDAAGFADFAAGPGRARHDQECAAAEECGVFGVPSLLFRGELFWGGDRIPHMEERLQQEVLYR